MPPPTDPHDASTTDSPTPNAPATRRATVWIDGDAAPRACKAVVYKAAGRKQTPVVVVANQYQEVPRAPWIRAVQVPGGPDVADDYIAERCGAGDLVLTADIPLAARAVEAGSVVLEFRGEELTEDNVRQRLSMRDFMDDLRSSGVMTGGPRPYGPKDKQRFANALDRWLARAGR